MKAVVYTRYGSPDVLGFTEVEKPAPKDNQVLVKVQAVSLTGPTGRRCGANRHTPRSWARCVHATTSWVGHRRTG